jgi:hypothetical protein
MNEKKDTNKLSSMELETFELETEFLGFTPLSFVDDIVNMVNEYLYAAADSLQSYIESINSEMSLSEIHRVRSSLDVSRFILHRPQKRVSRVSTRY